MGGRHLAPNPDRVVVELNPDGRYWVELHGTEPVALIDDQGRVTWQTEQPDREALANAGVGFHPQGWFDA